MKNRRRISLMNGQTGMVTPDAYSTAWVAMVPATDSYRSPAWPQALAYLRANQLPDGGWGSKQTFYAHGQTIATLAALRAFLEWNDPTDNERVERGVVALRRYAADLPAEAHQPIGFELLLPHLVRELERFKLDLPLSAWSHINKMAAHKLALIGSLQPVYDKPRAWWFSMEMLPEYQLAGIDERILDVYGSVVTSPAATAAYLRAKRLYGQDSEPAANFLEQVLALNGGGAGVCWPIDKFELIWVLDSLMRAGLDPARPEIAPWVKELAQHWNASPSGLSHSHVFPIKDGDHTAVAYKVLRWAGLKPSDKPLQAFWGPGFFLTYPDELSASVSTNVHALAALRHDSNNSQHREMAVRITEWLRRQVWPKGQLHDKWHFSPLYATSRAISALAGWDDALASRCLTFVLENQLESGGWGSAGRANLEESSYAVLGLIAARRAGLLQDTNPLRRAATYFKQQGHKTPQETLWIGKTLYQPIGVVQATVSAAKLALALESESGQATTYSLMRPAVI